MAVSTRPESTGTAVAVREKREMMRADLARIEPNLESMGVTPKRMTQAALLAFTKTPQLLDCSRESVLLAVMRIAQWGLEIGTTAHLVPFQGECTAIPDWKGLVQLVIESGHVRDIKALPVYSNERFIVREGSTSSIEHDRIWDETKRGELVAVYAFAALRRGGGTWEVMTKGEVDRIRAGAKSKDSPAWRNHYVEMARKTVMRRLCKRLPQSPRLAAALNAEELGEQFVGTGQATVVPPMHARPLAAGGYEVEPPMPPLPPLPQLTTPAEGAEAQAAQTTGGEPTTAAGPSSADAELAQLLPNPMPTSAPKLTELLTELLNHRHVDEATRASVAARSGAGKLKTVEQLRAAIDDVCEVIRLSF